MVQHQRWSTSCLTWSYFNRGGLTWNEAQEKAQNKKERREQRSWGAAGPAEEVEAVPTRKDREKKEEDKEKKEGPPPSHDSEPGRATRGPQAQEGS